MYESMQMTTENNRTYSIKLRMGFFKNLDTAINHAKTHADPQGVPYVMLHGKCVWSPLTEHLKG